VAPRKYFDLYPLEGIELASVPDDDLADVPVAARNVRPVEEAMDDQTKKEAMQAYYAAISFMDAQVGRLLDALDRLDLADNTIVIFFSDHGYHLGEHRMWQKTTLFENAARVPLVIYAPGQPGNGRATDGLAELVDVYPTLAELCSLPPPEHLSGRSLAPILRDGEASVRETALTQQQRSVPGGDGGRRVIMGYTIRTVRWRYTEWDGGKAGTELYDHQNDPREMTNLAGDASFAKTRADLAVMLKEAVGRSQ
jgi:uncharacterized sulfatase